MAVHLPIKVVVGAIDQASGPMRRIAKSMGRTLATVGKMGRTFLRFGAYAAAAGTAAGYAANRMLQSYVKSADELSKFSRQVGLSVEMLQELQFAAERQGISSDELNRSLEQMGKRMGELKAGTGSLAYFLKKASPSFLKQLQATKSNEEAFELLIQAMDHLKDPAKKSALAAAAFGRAGVRMTRIVDEGREALEKLREEKRRYGVISTEAARDAEDFQNSQENLKHALAGVRDSIMAGVVPALVPLIKKMTEWIVRNREFIRMKVAAVLEKIGSALADIGRWFWENRMVIKETLVRGFELVSIAVKTVADNIDTITEAVKVLAVVWVGTKLVSALGAANAAVLSLVAAGYMWKKAWDLSKELNTIRAINQEMENAVEKYAKLKGWVTTPETRMAFAAERGMRFALKNIRREREIVQAPESSPLKSLVEGEITINIPSAPPGTTIEKPKTKTKGLTIRGNLGRSAVGTIQP